jgi:alpha-beta hydrolase superfamily lysophospholipase
MPPTSIPADPSTLPTADPEVLKLNTAHRRAMPLQRLIDYGMSYEDASRLHALVEQGADWKWVAENIGASHLQSARTAISYGHSQSARDHYLLACAGFRAAQSTFLHDTPERLRLYRQVIDSFALAAHLMTPPPVKLEIPSDAGRLSGWWLMPAHASKAPVVIIFGGADGWREAYYDAGRYLLERGMSILLLDGPGQGESRLIHRVYIDESYAKQFSLAVDMLLRLEQVSHVALFGNSLGGTLAAGTAAQDPRIAAVCVNGGSAQPIEVLDRFPRFIERIAAMVGTTNTIRAREVLAAFDLGPTLANIKCPLLITHGGADAIFSVANARRIYDEAGAADRHFAVWEDGDHCVYNHAVERNCLIADWFSDRLLNS